ncbi:MAG TPA: sigma 54-interacting transcriptional regulator, partial [Thermoanaerobaculia bacterium]|nr:sigma 54-interacting transcriptional regulator [Thermoanaerobaculia bacterium]
AERLEAREGGLWQAVADYLATPAAPPAAFAGLLAAAGHAGARLWWESDEDARVLVPGTPSDAERREELAAPAAGGRLVLRAPAVDGTLRALFQVVRREVPRWLREMRAAPVRPGRGGPRQGSAASADRGSAGRDSSRRETAASVAERFGIVGESPELAAAVTRAARLAPAEVPLLVLGESGTGKELVARAVHGLSARRAGPLVAVNCAALSETLVLSDLFGHVRGAFTGADRDRAGVFETAAGGTVFLDEIGDLPAAAQGMLLRVLQEGEVRRLGESLPRRIDVRLVAATHRDLATLVADGAFRQDLYYRLKGAVVTLPPLRQRGDDVLHLADHLLAGHPAGRPPVGEPRAGGDAAAPRLTAEARRRLRAHAWPGNVRELQQVLAVAAALAAADGGEIRPEHLDLPTPRADAPAAGYHQQVESFRRRLVTEALEATSGHQAQAARRLGLSRQAMSYLVRELGVERPVRRRVR